MFERAKLFREKYDQVRIANDSASQLASQHKDLTDRISDIKYRISLLESEYQVLDQDVNEFLMHYYEKFSEELFINDELLKKYEDKRGENPEDKMNENIALYERKKKAREIELKVLYRKMVKEFHPDTNEEGTEREFIIINDLYEKGDLEGLIAIQTELDNQRFSLDEEESPGLVREIEMMESQEILLSRKLSKVKVKLSRLIASPEYRLYTRYKIALMRGEDFFETLLKAI